MPHAHKGDRTADSVTFTPLRWWRSPHTGARYPVAMRVDAAGAYLTLVPLMDDQEFDSRASTGAVYWEGAVTALRPATDAHAASALAEPGSSGAASAAQKLGRGYLELTEYFQRLDLYWSRPRTNGWAVRPIAVRRPQSIAACASVSSCVWRAGRISSSNGTTSRVATNISLKSLR
ncbi:lipocalin family protein [Trinickia violacea]|uniref:Lipocalin family protein n=1 Tax=Trinickia violacea TaxID=2571746 RepID=A0A4P8IRQ9_9BURK|nr:lipocalin family protein [Trinickia violacea]